MEVLAYCVMEARYFISTNPVSSCVMKKLLFAYARNTDADQSVQSDLHNKMVAAYIVS